MKKKYVVILVVILIIVFCLALFMIINNIQKNNIHYEIEQVKDYNYFVIKQDDKYGVMDKQGNVLVSSRFDNVKIPNPEKEVFICYDDDNIIILNENQEEMFKEFELVEPIRLKNIVSDLMYEKSVLKYKKDNKYGIINFEGKQITKPIYDEIDSFSNKEGELLVKQGDKYGVINIKGNKIINIQYNQIVSDNYYKEQDGYKYSGYIVSIKTNEGYRYGYVNYEGKEILKCEYNELSRITDIEDEKDLCLICAKNGRYGLNRNGTDTILNEYQSIRYDKVTNNVVIEKSKKYGVSSLDGNVIIPLEYNQVDINGMYLYAKKEQGTVVFDKYGKEVNMSANSVKLPVKDGEYIININSIDGMTLYGVTNHDEKILIKLEYTYIEYLYDKYFIACGKDGKLGILDDNGNIKLEMKYDSIQKISDTKIIQAVSSQSSITELYSSSFEKICEIENINIEHLDEYLKIFNEKELYYFDQDGKELKSNQIYLDNPIFASKNKDGKWGFVDKDNKIIINYNYDRVTEMNKYGFAGIKKDGKWGVVDNQGNIIVEPKYSIFHQVEPYFIKNFYKVTYGFGEVYYTDM